MDAPQAQPRRSRPPRPSRSWLAPVLLAVAVTACTATPGPPSGTSAPPSATPDAPTASATAAPTAPDSTTRRPDPPTGGRAPVPRATPPEDAPPSSDTGRLLVTDAAGTVSRIDPDTGEATPVASLAGVTQATPADEGATVVATGLDGGEPTIAVSGEGRVERIAAPTPPYFHLPSPDGTLLASLGDAPDAGTVALLVTDVAAGTTSVVDDGRPYFVAWRRDGQQLAAHVGATTLALVDVDGTRTPMALDPGAFQAPAWTTDDRLVAVVDTTGVIDVGLATGPSRTGLSLALPAGAGSRPRTQPAPRVVQQPAGRLVVVDPDTAATTTLADVSGAVSFDVAGERVAWVAGTSGQAASLGPLEVIGLDGAGRTTVSDDDVAMFEWSPDGRRLLFQVVDPERGLVPHVWDGSTDTAYPQWIPTATLATQYLPFWPQYALAVTQWAPDGTAFVRVEADDGDGPGTVVVVGLDGTRRELGAGEVAWWTP